MKKYFVFCFVYLVIFVLATPPSAAAFSLATPQPLFSSVVEESEVARVTNYPVWLRPSLEKAGWIKKGQVIDAATALSIEKRLCREFLNRSDQQCGDAGVNYFLMNYLANFSTFDKKSAPDTLLTSETVRSVVRSSLSTVSEGKQMECRYAFMLLMWGSCEVITLSPKGFTGVTKAIATKQVNAAAKTQALVRQLVDTAGKAPAAKRKEYQESLKEELFTMDMEAAQASLKKNKYPETFVGAVAANWWYETLVISARQELGVSSGITKAVVDERQELFKRLLADIERRHLSRANDESYLMRYYMFAKYLRNARASSAGASFSKNPVEEQVLFLDMAIDMATLVDLGAKAKI